MKPNIAKHNPDPDHIKALLIRAGLTQRAAAKALGLSARMMRYYVTPLAGDHRPAPYLVQFALESFQATRQK